MRRSALASIVGAVVLLLGIAPASGRATPRTIGVEPVATGLSFPAAFTFSPDGRIFYAATYDGEIHIYDPASGSDNLFFTIPGGSAPEGILGLVLIPSYPTQPYVYAYVNREVQGVRKSQILRIRDTGGIGTQPKLIYQADGGDIHHGGRMLFGSDEMLYVATGDEDDPAGSQNLSSTVGKMLRMTPTGQVPPGNPFGTLVWAYGLRNTFGWDFDDRTRSLWYEDNGPACNDEIDLIRKGKNYGWGPAATCSTPPLPPRNTNQDGPSPVLPAEYIATSVAPTGLAFCEGCGLTGADGTMFYGRYNTFAIQQVVLTADRRSIASDTQVYVHSSFPLSIEVGPDGTLYFSDDTAIYRLVEI